MSHWWDDPGTLASIAVIGSTVGASALWGGRKAVRISGRLGRFFDDWDGTDARPGVPASPGVMTRLAAIESVIGATSKGVESMQPLVDQIHHETQPNDGDSMNDKLNRVDKALKVD